MPHGYEGTLILPNAQNILKEMDSVITNLTSAPPEREPTSGKTLVGDNEGTICSFCLAWLILVSPNMIETEKFPVCGSLTLHSSCELLVQYELENLELPKTH